MQTAFISVNGEKGQAERTQTIGRTAGESAFNVARMMGHARSTLVDSVYAHTMQSGMASVAESVAARVLGVKPQLRVIEGGKSAGR